MWLGAHNRSINPQGGGGGAHADGDTVAFSGSGFGTNPGTQLFTGGVSSAIETAADDTAYTGICPASLTVPSFLSGQTWRVDTGRTYGRRTRTLLWDSTDGRNVAGGNQGEGPMVWSPGLSSLGSMYTAIKVYFTYPVAVTDIQLKFFRTISQYVAEGATGVVDSEGNNMLLSDRIGQGYFGSNTGATFPPFSSTTTYFGDSGWGDSGSIATLPKDSWSEIEYEFNDSSTLSSSDGLYSHKIRRLSDGAIIASHNRPNIAIYNNAGTRMKYLCLQNGLFNGAGTGIPEWGNGVVSMLDWFIMAGSRARVRLSNNATYASATISELCEITSWANTSIGVKLNQGAHSSLAGLYFHVWDATGTLLNATTGIALV